MMMTAALRLPPSLLVDLAFDEEEETKAVPPPPPETKPVEKAPEVVDSKDEIVGDAVAGKGGGETEEIEENESKEDEANCNDAAEDPAAEDPAAEDPAAEDPAAEEPAAEEPAAEEPATKEAATEEALAAAKEEASAAAPVPEDVIVVESDVSEAQSIASRFTIKQLRDVLRKHKLSTAGSKPVMVERLQEHGVALRDSGSREEDNNDNVIMTVES